MKKKLLVLMLFNAILFSCKKEETGKLILQNTLSAKTFSLIKYVMPFESALHEGTWLQWPHQFTYGYVYRNRLEATWVAMTKALVQSEKVHIIAYNETEKNRIITQLQNASVPLAKVDFYIIKTNDCWVRDNGPIFVKDLNNQLVAEDWSFNGWGKKAPFKKDDAVPTTVANAILMPAADLNNTLTIEGGAMELDGEGTFMATKTSVLNSNRNPDVSQSQAEAVLKQNLGITNFIWLNGTSTPDDITDMHIDGFAKFLNADTIVTMNKADLFYWYLSPKDIATLHAAKNAKGKAYHFIYLPLTKNNVITAYGKNLGYKGSYVNYYVANTKVLVPFYNDPNDAVAKNILQQLYPGRSVVGIDVRNLYEQGGMIHCVTQQQPE